MGRILILVGALFILTGLLVSLLPKQISLGRLPGDILLQKSHVTFYFPMTTCLLFSVILMLVLWLAARR